MFRIKICGITSADDGALTAAAGADAIGLNFYPRSPRFVSAAAARQIVARVPAGVVKVGLFVNAPPAGVRATVDDLGLDLVQLHGDEPPEQLAELVGLPLMRAFRVGPAALAPVFAYLERCRELDCLPLRVLLDASVPGQFGGTGQTADWGVVAKYPSQSWHPPLVLAGGLTSTNVAEAIDAVRPAAVDTASGVESSPGRKSPQRVQEFVATAQRAFASLRSMRGAEP